MDRGMKKWIYWGVYVFLTLAGFLACIFRLLPVVTPSVFLLGLYNLCLGSPSVPLCPPAPLSEAAAPIFRRLHLPGHRLGPPLPHLLVHPMGPLDRLYPSLFDPRLRLVPLPRLTAPPRLSAVFPLCSDPN